MDKFWNNKIVTETDCWEWQGTINYVKRTPRGYGVSYNPKTQKTILAHRKSWQLHNKREIPAGMVVMHKCDNTLCYNPEHLQLGTIRDNVRDMIAKGRAKFAWGNGGGDQYKIGDKCWTRGHELTADNISIIHYANGKTQRKCRDCKILESRRYQAKKRKNLQYN